MSVNTKIVHCKDVLYSHWIKRYLDSMGEKAALSGEVVTFRVVEVGISISAIIQASGNTASSAAG